MKFSLTFIPTTQRMKLIFEILCQPLAETIHFPLQLIDIKFHSPQMQFNYEWLLLLTWFL